MADKKCKFCSMMIPSDAKVCPYCRKTLSSSKVVVWLIIIILLLFGYTCSRMNFADYSTPPSSTQVDRLKTVTLTPKGQKIKQKHPSWANDICNMVAKKEIRIGMTAGQVRAAWGKPYRINTSTGSYGEHEQWVMSEYGSDYCYFKNGILTSIQQSHR
ncbi:MAG: hypothetical protein PHO83_03675 [Geobacteraceae bacterium]|nr:hypothetical protein [Geobacteraceae bacterium]